MKILILGANGMLGHDLAKVFSDQNSTLWDQNELDITNAGQVNAKISQLKPDVIINAAAFTDVDGAEEKRKLAFAVNADGVKNLAKICEKNNIILVHISTEYVFDGQKREGYREDSKISPLGVYGKSKADGEKLLQENCGKFYLVRTSWLFGESPQVGKPRGLNFVETMLKLAKEKSELKVVNDQFGKPTHTVDLARAIRNLIKQKKSFGIYHLVNEEKTSWYEFAQEIFNLKNIKINLQPCNSEEYPTPTPRPKNAVLLNTKFVKLRNWREALREYLK